MDTTNSEKTGLVQNTKVFWLDLLQKEAQKVKDGGCVFVEDLPAPCQIAIVQSGRFLLHPEDSVPQGLLYIEEPEFRSLYSVLEKAIQEFNYDTIRPIF